MEKPKCRCRVKNRNLKEGLFAGLEELTKRGPHAQWIADTTDIGVIGVEEQGWIDQEWYPRFLATGVTYMAIVQPKSAVAKLSVKHSVQESESKVMGTQLTIYTCTTLEDVRQWMQQQTS
jgi:hypothetical protein